MCAESDLQPFLAETVSDELFAASLPDELAARVVECLKQLADKHWHIDPRRSVEFARRIYRIGERRNDRWQMALGRMAHGDAIKFLGQSGEAWEALYQAGEMFAAAGDEVGWARTRIGRLYLSTMLDRVPQALAEAERARAILERHGEREKLLRLQFQLSAVLVYVGHVPQALEQLQSALTIAESLGPVGENYYYLLYNGIGVAYETLGDLPVALRYFDRAREVGLAQDEPINIAAAEAHVAHVLQQQGHCRRALQLCHQALSRVRDLDPVEATHIQWHMLECYLYLNRYAEARDLAEAVARDYRQRSDQMWLARTLVHLATAEAELNRYERANSVLAEAETIFRSLNSETWVAMVDLRRGRLALTMNDAATAHAESQQAAGTFQASGQQVNAMTATLLSGQAALAAQQFAEANHAGQQVLRLAQRNHIPSLRYTAHLMLGQVAEATGDTLHAVRHYRAAAATTERVQRGLTITLRPGFLEDKEEASRRLIDLYLRNGQAAHAFETLELSKSQVLLGYLANRESLRWSHDDPLSRELLTQLTQLRAAQHQHYQRTQLAGPEVGTVAPEVNVEAARRERQIRAITEQLYYHNGRRKIDSAPVVSLGQIQRALDPQTRLIEFYNDGRTLWAFSVDQRTVTAHPLPAAPAQVLEWIQQLRGNLVAALRAGPHSLSARMLAGSARRLLQHIHTGVLGPLALEGAQRLVMVPYGVLHYLPLSLLFDGQRYVVECHEVAVLPAASLLTQTGPTRQPGARVLAHSLSGRLPHTLAEARTIQHLLGGSVYVEAEATREKLRATPTQVLHIAAHGEYRLDNPDRSCVYLADGQIYADDLFQYDLSYELVTMSACETGRANVAGGDELIGLGRGFLYAGAGALVLSLWPVADEITLGLMERFYRALKGGASKSAALREAQCAELSAAPDLHPAFWGAFQLIGDQRPLTH
jgi:CHAT domain-containing protein